MQRRLNRRVLVIEDDTDIRRLITDALKGAGLDVVAAVDASQALRTALARKPAAVVLDIGLPDYDGTQFIARWRERRPTPTTCRSSSSAVGLTAWRSRASWVPPTSAGSRSKSMSSWARWSAQS